MTREKALEILHKHLKNQNLRNHCYAAEACMIGVYNHLHPNGKDEATWGISGLLHDADYETTKDTPQRHGLALFELEKNTNFPEKIVQAIKSHNFEMTGVEPNSDLDWTLIATDPITGLIVASALVTPDKKLSTLTTKSILKKFKQKSFARGVERDKIFLCEEKLDIQLEKFTDISLKSMQKISNQINL